MYYLRLFMRTLYISLIVGIIIAGSYYIYDYNYGANVYEASTGILVNEDINSPYIAAEEGAVGGVITDTDFSEYLLNVAIHYINTAEYQEIVKARLADQIPNINSYDFNKNVTTSTYAGSNVVTVTAKYENNSYYPVLIANTLTQVYKEASARKLGSDYFTVISEATRDTEPVNLSTTTGSILYGVAALVLTYVLILIIDALARSEGTYLSWKLFRKRNKKQVVAEEAG